MATASHDELAAIADDAGAILRATPDLYLLLLPDLRIVEASDAYLRATMTTRGEIVGRSLFEVFPNDPGREPCGGGAPGALASRPASRSLLDLATRPAYRSQRMGDVRERVFHLRVRLDGLVREVIERQHTDGLGIGVDNRDPAHLIRHHQALDVADPLIGSRRDHVPRHRGYHVDLAERSALRVCSHRDITIGDHAHQLAVIAHDGDHAAVVLPHELGGHGEIVVAATGDSGVAHEVLDSHSNLLGCCYWVLQIADQASRAAEANAARAVIEGSGRRAPIGDYIAVRD